MVIVAGDAAIRAVLRGEIRPLVLDVAFHLRGGGGGPPQKVGGKCQDLAVRRRRRVAGEIHRQSEVIQWQKSERAKPVETLIRHGKV